MKPTLIKPACIADCKLLDYLPLCIYAFKLALLNHTLPILQLLLNWSDVAMYILQSKLSFTSASGHVSLQITSFSEFFTLHT